MSEAPLTLPTPGGWFLYGEALQSRLLLGTARYPSLTVMADAVAASGADVLTLGLRRQSPEKLGGGSVWDHIAQLGCRLLPNTAGCHTAREAVTLARMSREIFDTDWIKLEVTGDDYNLQPDPYELIEATRELIKADFKVFAYSTDDLVVCSRLRDLGCEVIMPWGAPIGTGKGITDPYALETLRARLPDATLHRRCRTGPAVPRRPGAGDGIRRGLAEHRRRPCRRPRAHGRCLRQSRCRRPPRLRSRRHVGKRDRAPVDAGGGDAVLAVGAGVGACLGQTIHTRKMAHISHRTRQLERRSISLLAKSRE